MIVIHVQTLYPVKKPSSRMQGQILRSSIDATEKACSKAQLDTLNPNVVLGSSLENHFKEHTCKATGQGANNNTNESQEWILVSRTCLCSGRLATQFNETYPWNNDNKSDPLAQRKLLVEQEHREQGSCKNLHLVSHRVDSRVQIGNCYKTMR